jgi:UDP-N-acetylglucosamine--N-acetylmuramyl-(pentapeptide) pyrophosphoryl-undecaprenol N-acetylglucosamine transferase
MLRKEGKLQPLKFIVSGGGTGGHIFPAIAIANALKQRVPDAEFLFVGAEGRMEMEKVPAAGYKIVGLWISGLQRKLTFANLSFPFKVISSILRAKKIMREFKPHAVIGTGGYASGPMLRVASRAGVPTLIQEQNSYPGITNRVLSARVNRICVAYQGMEKYFPKEKIIFTGNPVRQDILNLQGKHPRAMEFFSLSAEKKTLLVIGGSLGARTINQSMAVGVKEIVAAGYQVIWQTGKTFIQDAKKATEGMSGVYVSDFITKMDLAYAAADLVVSRAGASSVSELCLVEKASILVPSPNVAEDHQTKNAMALVNVGAAALIKDVEAGTRLTPKILELFGNEAARTELQIKIGQLATPNAADLIAGEILTLVQTKDK